MKASSDTSDHRNPEGVTDASDRRDLVTIAQILLVA